MMKRILGDLLFLALAAMALVAMLAILTKALAHDWYPLECCHQMDCGPVLKVEVIPAPSFAAALAPLPSLMVVTTAHGSTVVPADFKPRQSPDGQMHACIRAGKLICLFLPPSM